MSAQATSSERSSTPSVSRGAASIAEGALLSAIGLTIGISLFFFFVPFFEAANGASFSQWMQGLGGPLGFVSAALVAYTLLLQYHQNARQIQKEEEARSEQMALGCEGLVDAYENLLASHRLIDSAQHLAPAEYRFGHRALDVLSNELSLSDLSPSGMQTKIAFDRDIAPRLMPLIRALAEVTTALGALQKCTNLDSRRYLALRQRMETLVRPRDRALIIRAWPDGEEKEEFRRLFPTP